MQLVKRRGLVNTTLHYTHLVKVTLGKFKVGNYEAFSGILNQRLHTMHAEHGTQV